MSEQTAQHSGLQGLKTEMMPEGLYLSGEFRGFEQKESKGNMYYKIKVLIGDNVKKLDVKPDQFVKYGQLKHSSRIIVKYYEFVGRFGTNSVCTDVIV